MTISYFMYEIHKNLRQGIFKDGRKDHLTQATKYQNDLQQFLPIGKRKNI